MERINKVAQITLLFWLMKIIATTLGETLGDYIAQTLQLGYTIALLVTLLFFLAVLSIQLFTKKYIPVFYWLVIIATTTLGTEISDFIDRSLHLGYTIGSVILFSCLAFILLLWHKKFKNLNVYPIIDRNKEIYYWLAILFSNSLGTAFGDYLSDVIGLTYLNGALVTAGVILIVVALHYATKINHILLFWVAFIFTRPFGATFGDFLTKPVAKGGLDLGTLSASMVSLLLMTILIIVAHKKHNVVSK
jgi:uncharacterized membrane-anchored protein